MLVRLTAALAAACIWLVATAPPVAAHGIGGVGPRNYDTRLIEIEPEIEDLDVSVVELGDRLEVTNDTDTELVVLGYEGEPYLRISSGGVFENERSPATWANRDRYAEVATPSDVDAEAEPVWSRVGDGPTARFHWHLAHWMARSRPAIVDDDPGAEHHILDWELVMERDGTVVTATGDLRWVPAPSPVAYVIGAVALVAGTTLLGRTRWWRWLLVGALGALVVAETAHLVGLWDASTAGVGSKVLENLYSIIGIALATFAIVRLTGRRRDPFDATPLVLVAGIVLAVAGGLADLGSLTASQLATSLDPTLARIGIMTTLGLGTGVVVVASLRLRRPPVPAPTRR